jgi:O-antigen ligase
MKFVKGQNNLLKYGLALVLITPLIFGRELLYPFVVYRTYFFYILIDILFALFIWTQGFGWVKGLWKSSVVKLFSIFMGIKIISDLFGGFFWHSFWGDYERMMGLLTWLHLFAFFIMAIVVFDGHRDYKKLFVANTGVATLVSLYGVLQYYSIAFVVNDIDDRLFSTIGNPAFLAGYLLVSFFIAIYLIAGLEKDNWRSFYCLSAIVILSGLYLTATRGALVALVVGLVFGAVYLFLLGKEVIKKHKNLLRLAIAAGGALLIFFGILFLSTGVGDGSNVTLRRLQSISLSDNSVRTRILLWSVGATAAKDNLLLGYGENNIDLALDRNFDSRIHEPWFDSSHNAVLDMLLAHGLLGVLISLVLFWTVVLAYHKNRKKHPLAVIFGVSAMVAYLVQSLFIFDTLVVLLPIVLLVSFAVVLEKGELGIRHTDTKGRFKFAKILVCGLVVVLLLTYPRSIRSLSQVTHGLRTVQSGGSLDSAQSMFKTGFDSALFGHTTLASQLRNASVLAIGSDRDRDKKELNSLLQELLKQYKEAGDLEGKISRHDIDPAKVLLELPQDVLKSRSKEIEELLTSGINLSPERIDTHFAFAQLLVQTNRTAEATRFLVGLLDVFENQRRDIYYDLAFLELSQDNIISSVDYLVNYLNHGRLLFLSDMEPFATAAIEAELWGAAIKVFMAMDSIYPNEPSVLANLAQAYKENDDPANARIAAERLFVADPSTSLMVEAFLEELK